MQAPLSTDVSKTEKVLLVPVVEDFDPHADMCAINWFNLKTPWLYRLYGLIASRFVRKVSGSLYFKGCLIRQIEGPLDRERENLLIVCYPGARKFLDLIDYKIFQLISVLRLAIAREKSGQQQSTEFFMDGIVLFAANSESDLKNFIDDDLYATFMRNNSESSLYLFSRTH